MNGSFPASPRLASPRTPARHSPPPPLRGAASFYSDGTDPPSSNKAGCPRPRRAGGRSCSLSPGHRPVAPCQVRGGREPPRGGAGLGGGEKGSGEREAGRAERGAAPACRFAVRARREAVWRTGLCNRWATATRPPAGAARRCCTLRLKYAVPRLGVVGLQSLIRSAR